MTTRLKKLVLLALALAIPSFALADKIPTIAKTKVGMSLAEFKKVAKNIKLENLGKNNVAYQKAGVRGYSFKLKGIDEAIAVFHNGKMIACSYLIEYKSDAQHDAIGKRILEILGADYTTHDDGKRVSWSLPQFKADLTKENEGKRKLFSLNVFHLKLFNQMEKDAESKVDVGF